MSDLEQLAAQLGEVLKSKGLKLATAESCTGGWVSQVITSVPNCSQWFERGFITYSDEAKQEMLGVKAETLQTYGAVSEETAREMAEGALCNSHAQVSMAVTGIAGPSGGSKQKPVGLVWFAWAEEGQPTVAKCQQFSGDRERIRCQAVACLIKGGTKIKI